MHVIQPKLASSIIKVVSRLSYFPVLEMCISTGADRKLVAQSQSENPVAWLKEGEQGSCELGNRGRDGNAAKPTIMPCWPLRRIKKSVLLDSFMKRRHFDP